MHDVRALNELVAKESAFVERLTTEVGKVIVGQTLHDRAHPHRPAHRRARPARRRAGPRQDAHRAHALRRDPRQVRPRPVHAGSPARRPHRHRHLQPAEGRVHLQARADLRQPRPRRRDQPRAGQGAERAARGDAGAAGHHRRQQLSTARSVRGHGHAEPDRAGRHLPAARGADRPLHAHGEGRLSRPRPKSVRSWTA